MAHRVAWAREALDDVDGIAAYMARESPAYAGLVVSRIRESARLLSRFPNAGHVVPEWNDGAIRERVVFRYRMIYRVQTDAVTVLAIIHGAWVLPDNVRNR